MTDSVFTHISTNDPVAFFILFFNFFPIIFISWRPNDPVSSEAQEGDVRVLMADSHCYTAETDTTL